MPKSHKRDPPGSRTSSAWKGRSHDNLWLNYMLLECVKLFGNTLRALPAKHRSKDKNQEQQLPYLELHKFWLSCVAPLSVVWEKKEGIGQPAAKLPQAFNVCSYISTPYVREEVQRL